jgi:hypothetical protein
MILNSGMALTGGLTFELALPLSALQYIIVGGGGGGDGDEAA